jgi:hypothetical protein
MKMQFGMMLLGLGLVATAAAQAPAGAPAGSMGICKDGTYSMQAKKEGACRGHKGVQTWYVADAAPAAKGGAAAPAAKATTAASAAKAAPTPAPTAKAMPAPTPAPSAPSRPAATAAAAPAAMPAPTAAAATPTKTGKRMSPQEAAAQKPLAPGGGPGLVWVNTESNVYHCNGDAFYGKTKAGTYMSEADAKAKGARGERGKNCAGK